MPYTIEEHKHRPAVWAAASAAMTYPESDYRIWGIPVWGQTKPRAA
jgi:hypothetical protein